MPNLTYILTRAADVTNLVVIAPGHPKPLTADSTQSSWDTILKGVLADDLSVVDHFDISGAIARRFDRLSDRITSAYGSIFLDGDEIDNSLTKQIIRFLDEGVDDWKPLVNFFEKVLSNPNEHSREQLYVWLDRHDFSITPEGDLIAYKGCKVGEDGIARSTRSGPGVVDGVEMNDFLPNKIGSTIEMARHMVQHDPTQGCSVGLHVGTKHYAKDFAQSGKLLEVHVNPRDVVSVPTDCNAQKVRVARYKVVREFEVSRPAYSSPLVEDDDYESYEF